MAGMLDPLVLLPRFTTYAGRPGSGYVKFATIAMDVTSYSSASLNVWRGKIVGTETGSPPVKFSLEESTDQLNWTACAGTGVTDFDPAENTEVQRTATLAKQWFRITVELGNANNVVACWAVGFLERRES